MSAGSQFFHVEVYSKKVSLKGDSKTNINGVLGEALRIEGYCKHVKQVKEPDFLFGSKSDLLGLEQEIEDRVKTEKDPLGRKIRDDANLLIAGVCSYHKPYTAVWDEDEKQNLELWKDLNLEFLKSEYGDPLRAVVLHEDEEHPHLHFYVVDRTGLISKSVEKHHSGYNARSKIDKKAGITDKTKAFSEAMQKLQDFYYEKVGKYVGMTRLGPKVQRLSRKEWKAQKRAAGVFADMQKALNEDKEIFEVEMLKLKAEQRGLASKVEQLVENRVKKIHEKFEKVIDVVETKVQELDKIKEKALKNYPEKEQQIKFDTAESKYQPHSKEIIEQGRAVVSKFKPPVLKPKVLI